MTGTWKRGWGRLARVALVVAGLNLPEETAAAIAFTGTNPPGGESFFGFEVATATTNLSLVLTNSSGAFSHLFLKRGAAVATNSYDHVARLESGLNAINLELPELQPGTNYSLLVYTPQGSGSHTFAAVLTTNRAELRTAGWPVVKPMIFSVAGTLNAGETNVFQVDVPTDLPGWRLVMSSSGSTDPDIYVRRGAVPTATQYTKRSLNRPLDTAFLDDTEATAQTYFVSVVIPKTDVGNATYSIDTEFSSLVTVAWDPGTNALGSLIYTNQSLLGGDYFLRLNTRDAASGVWRTRLTVASGEADLFVRRRSLPTLTTWDGSSARTGDDGVALAQPGQSAADQEWFLMVYAAPGSRWSLFSGNAFVATLPPPGPDHRGGTNLTVAPEGMNFYRTVLGADILAWRLGLEGLTNSVLVRKTKAAHPFGTSTYDWLAPGQMLLVPHYLKPLDEYFVTVTGQPGEAITLDSRQQPVVELPFGAGTAITATNYGYLTFRVQVPVQQIAWQLELEALAGQPDLAVREGGVPNEFQNTAFSESTNAVDEITLVPPTLTDGSFYLTVYGPVPYSATLTNRHPVITDVPFAFRVTNDRPDAAGWRYYRVANLEEQLGSLGWELLLEDQLPGTEIALRRNAAPGRWSNRTNNTETIRLNVRADVDHSSTNGFLQRPRQAVDVWYVGVRHPVEAAGPFTLTGRRIPAPRLALTPDWVTETVADQPPGQFRYFQVVVSNDVSGLDIRLDNVSSGDPRLVLGRELLPVDLRTTLANGNPWSVFLATNWPSGAQFAPGTDWTGFASSANGRNQSGHFLFAGKGNPLEPGTYYVGVFNDPDETATNTTSYKLEIRGLFPEVSFDEVAFAGGSTTTPDLPPHEVSWHRVVVPTNAPSWQVRVGAVQGDARLVLRREGLPSYGAAVVSPMSLAGRLNQQPRHEHFLLLPSAPDSTLLAGTYYLGIVGEGQGPSGTKAGSNTCTLTLTSKGPLALTDLGTVDATGQTRLSLAAVQEDGEVKGFAFSVAPNTPALEVRLADKNGTPQMVLRDDELLPKPEEAYTAYGGWTAKWSDDGEGLIHIPNPIAGNYRLLVEAAGATNATYTLEVYAVPVVPVAFDGGTQTVTGHPGDTWRYYSVSVPDNAVGWDLRLTDVTAGEPRLVICRDTTPAGFASRMASGGTWSPYTATNWPSGWQFAPERDWTGYASSAGGTNETGRLFAAGVGNPLEPGSYVIGVANRTATDRTNELGYTLVSRGIGAGFQIPVTPLDFVGGTNAVPALPVREAAYFSVEIPTNAPSWQIRLGTSLGDGLLLVRQDGLPNPGAEGTSTGDAREPAGIKVQKPGSEHFVLLPEDGATEIPAGTYYVALVSEGQSPTPPQRVGTGASDLTIESVGPLPLEPLGAFDPVTGEGVFAIGQLEGGEIAGYQFTAPEGTLGFVVSLADRVGNPCLTMKAGENLARSYDVYGRLGGWPEDWKSTNVVSLSRPSTGTYTLLVQACLQAKQYPDASYLLLVYPLVPGTLPFDGGCERVTGQPPGSWAFFAVDVPAEATGWDVRLRNVTRGDPRLVICYRGYPVNLTSRTPSGAAWSWGSATIWSPGNQAAPVIDWTGLGYNYDYTGQTGRVFVAGLGNPLEAGRYIVGVTSSTGNTNSTEPMSYTLCSRGIGANFLLPVTDLGTNTVATVTNRLAAREAAYYKVEVPPGLTEWKLKLEALEGDAVLVVQKGFLPNLTAPTNAVITSATGGRKLDKAGNEHLFVTVPASAATNLIPATYYLAVASQGANPDPATRRAGEGEGVSLLTSWLPAPVVDLGNVTHTAPDVVHAAALEAGETAAYAFSLAPGALNLELKLEGVIGNPILRLRAGGLLAVDARAYGQEGGVKADREHTNRIVLLNPAAGDYRLSILAAPLAGHPTSAEYTLRLRAETPPQLLTFDAGVINITNQASDLWKFFKVVVPPNALGWDLRLTNVTSGRPRLVVARDQLPNGLTSAGELFANTNWPSGEQLAPGLDWTGYNGPAGEGQTGRVFQVGMGNPLEPGVYYVGVTNVGSTNPSSYTIASRGIGRGFSIPVPDLPFTNGTLAQLHLPAREAAWYRVVVPTNTGSWKIRLGTELGDALLLAQKDYLPGIGAATNSSVTHTAGGRKLQKTGHEHLLVLASGETGQTNLPAGTYFLGVASEGLAPDPGRSWIGTEGTAFELLSEGTLTPADLGRVGTESLLAQGQLEGGEIKTWRFSVAAGVSAVEAVMEETNGVPLMAISPGLHPPGTSDSYGHDGGALPEWESPRVITIPNPSSADYALTVHAAASVADYPDATYRIRIGPVPVWPLSFDRALSSAGLSSVQSYTLGDSRRAYYRVAVPAQIAGQPVIGWRLKLNARHGFPALRVRKDALPDDAEDSGTSAYFPREAVFVPEYLVPGTWYVEVQAEGLCQYTIASESLALTRPPWTMPAAGEAVTTPGLPPDGAVFADTAFDPTGVRVTGTDGGLDLEQDAVHYYAVVVPPGNLGLLRSELDAISGNPDLYVRRGAPPTLSHTDTGEGGPLYDRALTSRVGTEYGNWVPFDGRVEDGLAPGLWYFAVHAAGGSNVRYRLRLSLGGITDLAFAGGNASGQHLAAGDWQYYRVLLPADLLGPWTVTFTEQVGDVVLYVRDTIPPGLGTNVTDYLDWADDQKNHGPYPSFPNPGSAVLPVPPLRPGHVYYLGFRAVRDSTFTVTSNAGTVPVPVDVRLAFKNGQYSATLPPRGALRMRVDVPADGRRWRHTSQHASSVRVYLDQGSTPTVTVADHWRGTGANSTLNAVLYESSWPWRPGLMYYLTATNTAATPQPFTIQLDGRDCSNDDYDEDTLPDCWEMTWFGSIYTYGPTSDPDGDGRNNADEWAQGSDPTETTTGDAVSLEVLGWSEGVFSFVVHGTTGQTYSVQGSLTLAPDSWAEVSRFVLGTPPHVVRLPAPADPPYYFYRVVQP